MAALDSVAREGWGIRMNAKATCREALQQEGNRRSEAEPTSVARVRWTWRNGIRGRQEGARFLPCEAKAMGLDFFPGAIGSHWRSSTRSVNDLISIF